MNDKSIVSTSAPPHCQRRTPSGRRCRMAISDPTSGLCFRHAVAQAKTRAQAALASRLIGDTQEFTSAVTINRSLGELYKLLARDEIAPRRAAVMAYTGSLLLRTLPAIEHEREKTSESRDFALDFSDWDLPHPLQPNVPRPLRDPSQPPGPAVHIRALNARRQAAEQGSGDVKKEPETPVLDLHGS